MALQTINLDTPNSGSGDALRDGGDKINDNFLEIYTQFGDGSTLGSFVQANNSALTGTTTIQTASISTALNLGAGVGLVFEGATDDAFETTLTVSDPTADRTITLPDASGTVMLTGKQTISYDLAGATPTTTNGASAFTATEIATNDTMLTGMSCAAGAESHFQIRITTPKSYNGGAIQAFIDSAVNTTPGSPSGNDYVLGIKAKCVGDGGTIDAAWGTAVEVTDSYTADDTLQRSSSIEFTPANAAGERTMYLDIYRDGTDGSDNLDASVILSMLTLTYTTNAANDD